ncbi:MAG: RES family NAD+ phosphorylase [Gemmatimonadota bacterium]
MARPGSPPLPSTTLSARALTLASLEAGKILYRIHRSHLAPLYFGRASDPDQRHRWDAPDASYGVCYLALEPSIAFAETLLRDLALDVVQEQELKIRSLARFRVVEPLRLVAMHGRGLRKHGADASVVQGPYEVTWAWSAAFHAHPDAPDGILYRARHDDSGLAVALFERARDKIEHVDSVGLLSPDCARELARWLDRYEVGLTS